MRREDVIKTVKSRLNALGVPVHMSLVRSVPGHVEVQVLTGDWKRSFEFRSGITPVELDQRLTVLENNWRDAKGVGGDQISLEEAIEESKGRGNA